MRRRISPRHSFLLGRRTQIALAGAFVGAWLALPAPARLGGRLCESRRSRFHVVTAGRDLLFVVALLGLDGCVSP